MTEQAIESRDITVTDIFQDFYRVPDQNNDGPIASRVGVRASVRPSLSRGREFGAASQANSGLRPLSQSVSSPRLLW